MFSRHEGPCGSLPAFASGDVASEWCVASLNPYPGHYSLAFAFSAFLYPHARGFALRRSYRLHRRRTGLPCSARIHGSSPGLCVKAREAAPW